MGQTEIHFDIETIESIHLFDKKESNFKYLPERPKKTKFFSLITTQEYKPAGYYEYSYDYWIGCYYENEDNLKNNYGFLIEDNKVYSHPYILIKLKNTEIRKEFNSFNEVKEYTEQLKLRSKKEFVIITF